MQSYFDFEVTIASAETDKAPVPLFAIAAMLFKILLEDGIRAVNAVREQFRSKMTM
jgi:hypothetical protein